MKFKQHSIIPGFGLTMGYSILYLSLIVLIPLIAIFISAGSMSWSGFWSNGNIRSRSGFLQIEFRGIVCRCAINAVFGLMVAWAIVRYSFPGKRIIDAIIDLPFALPTAVAGIALTTVYAPTGWIGRFLEPHGIKVAFTPLGVIIALTLWPSLCGAHCSAGFAGFE